MVMRRPHTIYKGNTFGKNFSCGHYVLIRENNVIGNNVSIGSYTELGRDNIIGDNVRIHSMCFIPEHITIHENAWLGPRVVILNTLHPPCKMHDECSKKHRVIIGENAKIGGATVICPHIRIGQNALVGAGSIVTNDVPADWVVVGNPAHRICKVSDLRCKSGLLKRPYC